MVMRLYLAQHAEPKSKGEDPERPLSEKGFNEITKMATYAKHHLHIEARQIFHSGKFQIFSGRRRRYQKLSDG